MRVCYTCQEIISKRGKNDGKPQICKNSNCKTEKYKTDWINWHVENGIVPNGMDRSSFLKRLPKTVLCKICNNYFTTDFFNKNLRRHEDICSSPECIDSARVNKLISTKIERYGHAGPNQEKFRQTSLEKFGTEHPSQSSIVKEKSIQTCLNRYGVDNASKSPEIIEKIAQSFFDRYGVRNVFQNKELMHAAFESKYGEGIVNPSQIPGVAMKAYNTRKERYELHGAVPKDKYHAAMMEKHGVLEFFSSERGKMTDINLKLLYRYNDEEISAIRKSQTLTLERIEQKYGTENAEEIFAEIKRSFDSSSFDWALEKAKGNHILAQEIYTKRVLQKTIKNRVSQTSLKVFKELEEYLILNFKDFGTIYVGDSIRKEYFLYDNENKCIYFYDFTIINKESNRKCIIEYNGCYYHAKTELDNPESFAKDKCKRELAIKNGFHYITVWDDMKHKDIVDLLKKELETWLKLQN